MRIGIAFSLAPDAGQPVEGPDDRYEEFDKPETVSAIAEVLRGAGHEVLLLGDGRALIEKLLVDPPELVWNLAEGEGIGRCREARVPALLEMLGIPCTGSDPLTLAAALDKELAKTIVRVAGVAVPAGLRILPGASRAELEASLSRFAEEVPFPWLLKPAFEGSSKGIRAHSLVDSVPEAMALVDSLASGYEQPILVEEFIDGDELTVGLIGEGATVEILGAMRVVPRRASARFVYSLEMKRSWSDHLEYETPAVLPSALQSSLEHAARSAFVALGCRDVARIDFRLREGAPVFLEANPLPGLAPGWSDLVILARGMGLSHADLILRVLDATLDRLGRTQTQEVIP